MKMCHYPSFLLEVLSWVGHARAARTQRRLCRAPARTRPTLRTGASKTHTLLHIVWCTLNRCVYNLMMYKGIINSTLIKVSQGLRKLYWKVPVMPHLVLWWESAMFSSLGFLICKIGITASTSYTHIHTPINVSSVNIYIFFSNRNTYSNYPLPYLCLFT